MKKYLDFMNAEYNPKRKTKVFHIFNCVTNEFLGKIKWRSGWRQYVSSLENDIEFSEGCHREIASFIKELMDERKK